MNGERVRNLASVVIGSALLLAGCTKPIPPERSTYVGEWRAPQMAVVIGQDGNVVYRRVEGGNTATLSGSLKEFVGDDFVVGIWPFLTTFDVTVPPHEQDGVWSMTVDGVELRRE
jgi:hypothetical protein